MTRSNLCYVYRLFNSDHELLYVGCSFHAIGRILQLCSKPWFDQVSSIRLEKFKSRVEALKQETKAIRSESPVFNIAHNPSAKHDVTVCPTCSGTGITIDREELKKIRLAARFTLVATAARMGLSTSYLCDLENGRRAWNTELLSAFNKAIGK